MAEIRAAIQAPFPSGRSALIISCSSSVVLRSDEPQERAGEGAGASTVTGCAVSAVPRTGAGPYKSVALISLSSATGSLASST